MASTSFVVTPLGLHLYGLTLASISHPVNEVHYRPFHPLGIIAAAISDTPLSVASILNCAAALRVSTISIRIPSALMCFLVSGESGYIAAPIPIINRSITDTNPLALARRNPVS